MTNYEHWYTTRINFFTGNTLLSIWLKTKDITVTNLMHILSIVNQVVRTGLK